MILILTDKNDSHGKHVIDEIKKRDLPYFEFRLDVESLSKTAVAYINGEWRIDQNEQLLELNSVKCVWNRRTFVELLLDEEYDQSVDFKIWKNEWNKTLLGIYSNIRHVQWLNPWREAYKAENKYWQMELATRNGLKVPNTIATNNKGTIEEFIRSNGDVVLKLMHQDFYRTSTKEYKGLYVNKINLEDIKNFHGIEENPIVLQKYIEKKYEVRYTVVGEKHFVCKIESQRSAIANIDWRRYDIPNTPHSIMEPPEKIKISVSNLMQGLSIEYGALDFIVDKEDEWYFLEVNSMGQFLWIEDLTGLNISAEIINWLENNLHN